LKLTQITTWTLKMGALTGLPQSYYICQTSLWAERLSSVTFRGWPTGPRTRNTPRCGARCRHAARSGGSPQEAGRRQWYCTVEADWLFPLGGARPCCSTTSCLMAALILAPCMVDARFLKARNGLQICGYG
ncbi:unnamed protein product, partial [Heterosigma akashiwo]